MSVNTRHSFGLLIVNDVPDYKGIVDKIKADLYSMNMILSVLHDKTAEEIRKEVEKLAKLDSSFIEEIIIIIHTTRHPGMTYRQFKCEGVILDIHYDILKPLLSVTKFKDKFKLIIVGGPPCKTEPTILDKTKPKLLDRSSKMVCILWSKNENFVTTFISELVKKKGNIIEVLDSQNISDLTYIKETTANISHIKIWKPQFLLETTEST